MFKRALMAIAVVGLSLAAVPIASASAENEQPKGPLTLAVFGDSPYGRSAYAPAGQTADSSQFQKSPAFIDTINSDPSISKVIHVGDIHSGKEFCTETYDNSIVSLWQNFQKPLVYTPGDNEWADCHKATSAASPWSIPTSRCPCRQRSPPPPATCRDPARSPSSAGCP